MSAVISRMADRWFAAITVEVPNAHRTAAENQGAVDVDLGVSALATLSTGERMANRSGGVLAWGPFVVA